MNLPTPSEDNNAIFEQMGQLFIDCYEELVSALDDNKCVEYSTNVKTKKLVDFQERYTAIIKEYQEQILSQPVQEEGDKS